MAKRTKTRTYYRTHRGGSKFTDSERAAYWKKKYHALLREMKGWV